MLKRAYNQHSEIQAFIPCPQFDTETNKTTQTKTRWISNKRWKRWSRPPSFIINGNTTEDACYFTVAESLHVPATSSDTYAMKMSTLQHFKNSLETLCL